jgi:hypothetical protein
MAGQTLHYVFTVLGGNRYREDAERKSRQGFSDFFKETLN